MLWHFSPMQTIGSYDSIYKSNLNASWRIENVNAILFSYVVIYSRQHTVEEIYRAMMNNKAPTIVITKQ